MKTESEVNAFKAEAVKSVYDCPVCSGALDVECACTERFDFNVLAFEACIPKDFWSVRASDVEFNTKAFKKFVKPYVKRLARAHKHGYGLVFVGDNGVGKTMFISYVLTSAMRRGRSAYYTTMLQLNHDIKRGFGDQEAQDRLEWLMTSDFLAVDEMGKEQFKDGQNTFIKTEMERILKQRFDDSKPVLIGTNLSNRGLEAAYGATVASIVRGKYQQVIMEPGDLRGRLADKMAGDMGYPA